MKDVFMSSVSILALTLNYRKTSRKISLLNSEVEAEFGPRFHISQADTECRN
jgi:hypothetical protein